MSTVWHARAAGKDWQDAYLRLTPEERADIDGWKVPTDIRLDENTLLRYRDAHKETPVALGDYCEWVDPSDPNALTAGTCDFYWHIGRTLFVGDLKKSEYTEPDGPRSLQIVCYALALAAKAAHHGLAIDGFVCGIWHAEEGTWEWGDYVALDSDVCGQLWDEVRAAALHTEGDFNTGKHCRRCYSRERCPAYLVPPDGANESIVRFLTGQLTHESALELRLLLERVEKTAKTAKASLQIWADKNGGIKDGDGKVWRKVQCKGRPMLNATALEADHPELFREYYRQGAPYDQYRWVNEEKGK